MSKIMKEIEKRKNNNNKDNAVLQYRKRIRNVSSTNFLGKKKARRKEEKKIYSKSIRKNSRIYE